MYENIANLIVFISAVANFSAFFSRWKKLSLLYKEAAFNMDSTKTYFVWDPYGKPRKRLDSLVFWASVAFAPPIFISWFLVILLSMITAFPFLIVITGLYILVRVSDYELLDFAKNFIKSKPTKIGEGDLNLLKQTQKVLYRSMLLSLAVALTFLLLTVSVTVFLV